MPFELDERSRGFLDWPELLACLAAEARSERGRAACQSLPLGASAAESRARAAEVAELAALLRAGGELPGLDFPEVEPFLEAAGKGMLLGPEEMRPVADLCEMAGTVARRFDGPRDAVAFGASGPSSSSSSSDADAERPTPLIAALMEGLDPCRPLAARIRATFDSSGEVRDAVSPELARLRREREALSAQVRSAIEELMRAEEYASVMQDEFWTVRADRYVLPLKASAKSLGLGIVHDTSRTGETVFVEPTVVVGLNNRLKLAELAIAREIRRILEELTREIADAAPALRGDLELLATLDVIAAKARLSVRYGGHPVELCEGAVIELRAARHPLLTLRAARERFPVVENDVSLTGQPAKVLIISGPNAGGKTVLLKTLGLSVLLARAGMLVPAAPGGRIGFFDAVLADIGDQQSVMGDLSTFSAHLANIAQILRHGAQGAAGVDAGGQALVLLDELMAGTNPEQGAALARATAETLAARGGLVVITTHYDALKALAEGDPRFRNAGMEYDPLRLTPTFRLKDGAPGRSYALDIAARMGLPEALIARAGELAGDASVGLEQVIASLESREAALAQETARLAETRQALASREEDQRVAVQALERRERELGRHSREAIELSVREAREAIKAIVRQAQQAGTARAAEEARGTLAAAAQAALAAFPEEPSAAAPPPGVLPAGARVWVASLGAMGQVTGPPDARGRVRVAVGALNVEVDGSELSAAAAESRGSSPAARPVWRAGPGTAAPAATDAVDTLAHERPTPQNTLDLRGRRADDVIGDVEIFLDRAALAERSPVFVIHGHGTNTLKKIVRDYLARSAYVRRWSPGGKGQGGDGVTVIEL